MIDAGRYDGALGVVSAIAAVKALQKSGRLVDYPRPIEVTTCIYSVLVFVVNTSEKYFVRTAANKKLRFQKFCFIWMQIIAFSDEEGVRFQSTFLGSGAIAGTLSPNLLQVKDKRYEQSDKTDYFNRKKQYAAAANCDQFNSN